ncbi:hypothetical protein AWV80_17445 [Cupriavidus sp. UYMU48A]|nr:hypothetical protein AWV80_17445 [Cupriavidus sp. UYMU48A]
MLENGLHGPCIGVIYDGAGYGSDGLIWGSEFLTGNYNQFTRNVCLRPIKLLGGDKAVQFPIRTGLALLLASFDDATHLLPKLPSLRVLSTEQQLILAQMFESETNAPECSSMGRLFDGIAALLGLADVAEYEAQGPIELEGLLMRDLSLAPPYPFSLIGNVGNERIEYRTMVRDVVGDLISGIDVATISRRFHSTIVDFTCSVCVMLRNRTGIKDVVLSGGVFLNEFLLVNSVRELRKLGLQPHHQSFFPPNDGGVSAGQLAVCIAQTKSKAEGVVAAKP